MPIFHWIAAIMLHGSKQSLKNSSSGLGVIALIYQIISNRPRYWNLDFWIRDMTRGRLMKLSLMLAIWTGRACSRDRTGLIRQMSIIYACSLVTGYSNQHFSVRKIFKKYWNLLKNDKVLGPILLDHPVVIFRGAPSLHHRIAPNVVNPPKIISFF